MAKSKDLDLTTLLEAIDKLESLFAIYDNDFNLVFANRASHEAWPDLYAALQQGCSQHEAIEKEITRQFPDRSPEEIAAFTEYAVKSASSGERGESRAQNGRIYRTWHEKMGDDWVVAVGLDLTDLKKQERQLSKLASENFNLANVDELTGLANRRHFVREIDRLLSDVGEAARGFCLCLMDLDGFKIVNDVYGHPMGDVLLKEVAHRLDSALGDDCVKARLGGDEFAILIQKEMDRTEIEDLAAMLREQIEQPYLVGDESVRVGASMGFVCYPDAGTARAQLLSRADFALYHSKQNQKGGATIFSAEHEEKVQRDGSLELALREADIDEEFYVLFQPLISAVTGETTSIEALARWQSPLVGAIPPAQFVPIAERSGYISKIAQSLFRKAVEVACTWPEHVSLSFNLSPIEVRSIDHVRALISIVEEADIAAGRIIFELTETAMIGQSAQVMEILRELKECGVKVALDDFGTGYSSLNYLSHMPLDIVKIDRAFLEGIEQSHASSSVLKSICDLCRNLGLTNVIEGVETELQAKHVKVAGVDMIQGYLYSRPITASDIEVFLEDKSDARTAAKIAS